MRDSVPSVPLLTGEYLLGVQGFAILRRCMNDPASTKARTAELLDIAARIEMSPYNVPIPMAEVDVIPGYSGWASIYDLNRLPTLDIEEETIDYLLADVKTGVAVDAGCGTGRHASRLSERGHKVIGVDVTPQMLALAKTKAPECDFRLGSVEALPLESDSADLLVCGLVLTHIQDLKIAFNEFRRVVRPGGRIVVSDLHPMTVLTGAVTAFPTSDPSKGLVYVRNFVHHMSDYIEAIVDAGLSIHRCVEPKISEEVLEALPSFALIPEATRESFSGLPDLLVWSIAVESQENLLKSRAIKTEDLAEDQGRE